MYYGGHFKAYNFEIKKNNFFYYNIPCFTKVDFSMISLLENVDGKIPDFGGIKYTNENFADFLSCLHFQSEKYDLIWVQMKVY